MALVCEITLQSKTLLIYNLHLESRGSSRLRMGQLSEALTDLDTRSAQTSALIAGDFNFDLSVGPAAGLIETKRMTNLLAGMGRLATVPGSHKCGSSAIDWILARGEAYAICTKIHATVTASDHFPLSVDFRLL
jgi:endonuclease/exonuclease/phosphatase family metal-dependent hydrolase